MGQIVLVVIAIVFLATIVTIIWHLKHRRFAQQTHKLESGKRPVATTAQGILCPNCGSNRIKKAGYSNRLECTECHKIFT